MPVYVLFEEVDYEVAEVVGIYVHKSAAKREKAKAYHDINYVIEEHYLK